LKEVMPLSTISAAIGKTATAKPSALARFDRTSGAQASIKARQYQASPEQNGSPSSEAGSFSEAIRSWSSP